VSDFSSEKFISKVRFSVTVSAEGVRVGKCRINSNVYPAVSCVASLYTGVGLPISTSTNIENVANNVRVGVPVSFRAITECMGAYFHRDSPELVRRGLNPAVDCLGYVEVVKGPYRVKYVPTLMGVIDSAIYLALFNTLLDKLGESGIELTSETIYAFVRFMRFMTFWESLTRFGLISDVIGDKVHLSLSGCHGGDDSCRSIVMSMEGERVKLFNGAVIAKAIAGRNVRGLKPWQLGDVFKDVYNIVSMYVERLIRPSNSAEAWRKVKELVAKYCKDKDDQCLTGPLKLAEDMEAVHRLFNILSGRATVYLISKLIEKENLNKPVTNTTTDSENKQSRLRR
jgi:hypothetical protein